MATMITNSLGRTTYQSRWGFHPCSYEDFLKYKELHKRAWSAMRLAMTHHRWVRKLPSNRKGPEPVISDFQRESGMDDLAVKRYYQDLLMTYRRARMPVDTPDEVSVIVSVGVWG